MADIYQQIKESLDDGYTDAEAIAIRTGLETDQVEAYLSRGKQKSSGRRSRVMEDLREIDVLISISQSAFRDRPGQSQATALNMLMSARRALRAELDTTTDPTDQVRKVDESLLVPFLKATILAAGSAFRSTIDEATHFLDPSQIARLQDLVQRQYRLVGGEVQKSYETLNAGLLQHFQTSEADGYALMEASRKAVADSAASLPKSAAKAARKPGKAPKTASGGQKRAAFRRLHRVSGEIRDVLQSISRLFPA